MPGRRVLLTTDEYSYTLGLVEGYRALGWQVVVGANNFRLRSARFDMVHHQWPEEFSRWQVPTQRDLDEITGHLEWWKAKAKNVFTVNNLYPHQREKNPLFHKLYSLFYKNCQLISH